jgi:threonine dehydrogenase-like Zn-dependent dehydrogenase
VGIGSDVVPGRFFGYGGMRAPKTRVRGSDVAGRVEAVGTDVTGLRPGDEVYGIAEGSFAEYAVATADKLAPKPRNLTHQQAAAVPTSALAALQGLHDRGQVQPGRSGRTPSLTPVRLPDQDRDGCGARRCERLVTHRRASVAACESDLEAKRAQGT